MNSKTALALFLIIALALAGFFGYKAMQPTEIVRVDEDLERITLLEEKLAEQERAAQERSEQLTRKHEQEAQRLGEELAAAKREANEKQRAELEEIRKSEIAAKERATDIQLQAQEERARMLAEKQAAENESERLKRLRAEEAAKATAKLKEAQLALAKAEERKQQEISEAREAALQEAMARMQSRAEQTGTTTAISVIPRTTEEYDRISKHVLAGDRKRANHINLYKMIGNEN